MLVHDHIPAAGLDESAQGMPTAAIEVYLAFDHPVVAAGVRMLLAGVRGIDVVGTEAADLDVAGAGAVIVAGTVGGRDERRAFLRALAGWDAGTVARTVLLARADRELLIGAVRIGVRCLVASDGAVDELVRAIRAADTGSALVAPTLVRPLLDNLVSPWRDPELASLAERLTPREWDVFVAVRCGQSNAEIARQLTVSVRTVKFHVSNILGKLHLGNRAQLIALGNGMDEQREPVLLSSRNPRLPDSARQAQRG